MPEHLTKMLPEVVAGDPTATLVFLAEGLKAKSTGKGTSTREMTDTGTWGQRDPKEATAEQGRRERELRPGRREVHRAVDGSCGRERWPVRARATRRRRPAALARCQTCGTVVKATAMMAA